MTKERQLVEDVVEEDHVAEVVTALDEGIIDLNIGSKMKGNKATKVVFSVTIANNLGM